MTKKLLIAILPALVMALPANAAQLGHANLKCAECHITQQTGAVSFQTAAWSTQSTADGIPTFKLYSSPRFNALNTDIGQPDGASKMCLGCHDGSYTGVSGSAVFGMNSLARSHPISFTYDSSLASRVPRNALRDPSVTSSGLGGTIAKDMLDQQSKMQCTSCHDVHDQKGSSKMLRLKFGPGTNDPLCRACHNR